MRLKEKIREDIKDFILCGFLDCGTLDLNCLLDVLEAISHYEDPGTFIEDTIHEINELKINGVDRFNEFMYRATEYLCDKICERLNIDYEDREHFHNYIDYSVNVLFENPEDAKKFNEEIRKLEKELDITLRIMGNC